MPLQNFRLFFPVNITLFYGNPDAPDTEPYFRKGICHHYIQAVNAAFLEHPMTNAFGNGLMKYFACEDEPISYYVKNKITSALPQIAYFVDGNIYGVVTYLVDSYSALPQSVVEALKADLRRQLTEDWGKNEFDIATGDSILYFHDGSHHLDREWDIHEEYPDVVVEKLHSATLNVRFTEHELSFIDTLDELKSRIANI